MLQYITLKNTGDATAIGAVILSLIKAIPWPEIGAFLGCIYLVCRIYYIIKNKGKE